MEAYLGLYFLALVLALLFYYFSRREKRKSRTYENVAAFFILLMMFFFVFALATKDPIENLLTTIPAFWQFMLTAIGGAFTIWKVYLNPLKERVISLETDVASLASETNTNFNSIKEDLKMIKEAIFKKSK